MTTHWKELVNVDSEEEAAKALHFIYIKMKSLQRVADKYKVTLQTLRSLFLKYNLSLRPWGGGNRKNVVIDKAEWRDTSLVDLAHKHKCSVARVQKATKNYGKKRKVRQKVNQKRKTRRCPA